MDTAADAVVGVPPPDDAGARTADLYEWQAAMAAADGLSILLAALDEDGQVSASVAARVLCEHHEDWVVICDPDAELVSAKHRESASGAWTTINQLVTDGGLGHLFGRWLALGCKPRARLVTCAGLAAGGPQQLAGAAAALRAEAAGVAVDAEAQTKINTTVEALAKALLLYRRGLPGRWQAPAGAVSATMDVAEGLLKEVRGFLAVLVIDDERPNRVFTEHAAPNMYVHPILVRLGRTDVPPPAVWEAVLALFRSRMRGKGPIASGALPLVLTNLGAVVTSMTTVVTMSMELERDLEARTVTVHDIALAVRMALGNPLGYLPISPPARLTKLSIKMARGGCASTSIERAEMARIDYRRYWRERRDNMPGTIADRIVVERALMRAADDATAASRTAAGAWGAQFWTALAHHLGLITAPERPDGFDDELARGGVCELAAQCRVWFSEWFDVDAEIARLRAERTAQS